MAAVASSSHLHLHLNHLIINSEQQPEQTAPELKLQPSQQLGKLWEQALQQPIKFTKSANPPSLTQIPYPPINHTLPPPAQPTRPSNPAPTQPSNNNPTPSSSAATATEHANKKSTISRLSQPHSVATQVATSWIRPQPIGPGFHNTGNTCFLNATLQALVHTPALAIGLMDRNEHSPESCELCFSSLSSSSRQETAYSNILFSQRWLGSR